MELLDKEPRPRATTLRSTGHVRLRRAVIGEDIKFTVHLGSSMVIMTENTADAVATYSRLTSVPQSDTPVR
jgi:hypothetical protein